MMNITDQEIQTLITYFDYYHLPDNLQLISEPFHKLAHYIDRNIPNNEEKKVGLRKLLEAKDCAVRAAL